MPHFAKEVDLTNRKAMEDFLKQHFRYWTGNSWNRSQSYANKVKIDTLNLPDSIPYEKALDFLFADHMAYDFDVSYLVDEFTEETGYTAGFNGRSSGYIVMYETTVENGKRAVFSFRSIDDDIESDIEDWDDDYLKSRVQLVQRFDKLCDDIRDTFIDYVGSVKTKTIKYLSPTDMRVTISTVDEEYPPLENVPDYEIYIRYNMTNDNYVAEVPELENCTAEGNTIEECAYFAEAAILDWIAEAKKKKIDVPAPKKK